MSKQLASASLSVVFLSSDADNNQCPEVLFEIPNVNIPCGSDLEIKLWANNSSFLNGYSLKKDDQDLGTGTVRTESVEQMTEEISFSESNSVQVTRPIASSLVVNPVVMMKGTYQGDTLTGITNYTGDFKKLGGSCVGPTTGEKLFGHATVSYMPGSAVREWKWEVDCSRKNHWFFLYKGTEIVNKFAIEVNQASGTAIPQLRTVTLKVIEFSSEVGIPGASVYIGGTLRGTTDSNGELVLSIMTGSYSLRITKSGFLSSDEDDISNDEINIT